MMNMDLETGIKKALKDIDRFKTSDCLDSIAIGQYAESTLTEPQRQATETHLHSCLYCLQQLNDMTAFLTYQEKRVSLAPRQEQMIQKLFPTEGKDRELKPALGDRLRGLFKITKYEKTLAREPNDTDMFNN